MLRIHGLSPEQMGALLRLMADNQGFDEVPPLQPGPRPVSGGAAGDGARGAPSQRSGIEPQLRLVRG